MHDVNRETCFSQKNVYKWAEHGFTSMSRKTVHEVETHGKEKVPGGVVSKKEHTDSLPEHERTCEPGFLRKMCHCKQCFLLLNP